MNTRTLLKVILPIQFILLAMVGLETSGFSIPVIRQITGFLYLTFVPGALVLRALRLGNHGTTEYLLFSVGSSITLIMLYGAFITTLLPIFGIYRPLSTISMTISMAVPILILSAALYIRDRTSANQTALLLRSRLLLLFSSDYLWLLLLPILTLLGTLLINYFDNRFLSVLVFLLVAITAVLVISGRFIRNKAYPFAVLMIALSLVLQVSLISWYPIGWNLDYEYLFASGIAGTEYWSSDFSRVAINSALGIVILAPTYSKILDIDTIWVFKVIYPFLQALIPLVIYTICQGQMSPKKAFLVSFFIISITFFINFLPMFRRDQLADLFTLLLLLNIVSRNLTTFPKTALTILFLISIPISHYATAYVFFALVLLSWVIFKAMPHLQKRIVGTFRKENNGLMVGHGATSTLLNNRMIQLFFVFMIVWIFYISYGTSLINLVFRIRETIMDLAYFFAPEARSQIVYQAMGIGLEPVQTVLHVLFRITHYTIEALIIIGFIALLIRPKQFELNEEFRVVLLASILIYATGLFLPYLGIKMGLFRMSSFIMLIIAPLVIVGYEAVWRSITNWHLPKSIKLFFLHSRRSEAYLGFFAAIIIIPYFLFNTGVVNEVAKNFMEITGVTKSQSFEPWGTDSYFFYRDTDIHGAQWTVEASDKSATIIGDHLTDIIFSYWIPGHMIKFMEQDTPVYRNLNMGIPDNALLYLRAWNIQEQEFLISEQGEEIHYGLDKMPELQEAMARSNRIYSNGGAEVFSLK